MFFSYLYVVGDEKAQAHLEEVMHKVVELIDTLSMILGWAGAGKTYSSSGIKETTSRCVSEHSMCWSSNTSYQTSPHHNGHRLLQGNFLIGIPLQHVEIRKGIWF